MLALDSVSFSAPRGAVVGLTGHNGSGKSTLIRILATLLLPTAGRAMIGSRDVAREPDAARERIGVSLVNERSLYWRLSGMENLVFFGRLTGLSRRDARERAEECAADAGIGHIADRLVSGMSAGERQRVMLARAGLRRPPVLLLDEPTKSLDAEGIEAFSRFVQTRAGEGTTVLVAAPTAEIIAVALDLEVRLTAGRIG